MMARYSKSETERRNAITDDDWRAIDALLQSLPPSSSPIARHTIDRVHAIKVAINTRHYSTK